MRKYFPEHKFSIAYRKKILAITITLVIYSNCSMAQSEPLLKLPAHTHLSKVSWRDSIYMFSDFLPGKLTLRTGFTPVDSFRFNYNLYFGSVDYISSYGDTLQVKPSPELKIIGIGGLLFVNHSGKGYIEVILNAPVSLGAFTILRTEKMVFISGNREGSENADLRGIPSVYDRYYRLAKSFFFIDQRNEIHKAMRKSIIKLFPNQKERIKEFVERNRTDFTMESDLKSLLNFCNQL